MSYSAIDDGSGRSALLLSSFSNIPDHLPKYQLFVSYKWRFFFSSKFDANPDLYGLVWISTTLVFVIAFLGNCAPYLMYRRSDHNTSWTFNVSYVNVAACSIYGYSLVVPLAYYFLLQYLGSNASLIRFWYLWGYSLFIFILRPFLLVIPVEFLRWTIILLIGGISTSFVALNLRSYIQESEITIVVISALLAFESGSSSFFSFPFNLMECSRGFNNSFHSLCCSHSQQQMIQASDIFVPAVSSPSIFFYGSF